MFDDRQRCVQFRRPIMVHLTGRLQTVANLEQPVRRVHFRVYRIEHRARVDHRRHLPQERLLGLPREPALCRFRRARRGRAKLRHGRWCANADDRVRERERHRVEQRIGTRSECRVAQQDSVLGFALLCRDELFCLIPPPITDHFSLDVFFFLFCGFGARGVDRG